MTESSHPENQSHPVISKDALRLHLSYARKVHFLFRSSFPGYFPFICLVFLLLTRFFWLERKTFFGAAPAPTGEYPRFYETPPPTYL